MSTRRKIVIFSVILLVSVLMFTSSVIFVTKKTEVIFAQNECAFSQEEVLDASNIGYNKSIFFVSKKKISSQIEKAIPKAKVEKVEKCFPNKIKLYVSQRQALFVVKQQVQGNTTLLCLDEQFKIIEKSDVLGSYSNLIEIAGVDVLSYDVGNFVDCKQLQEFLSLLKDYTFTNADLTSNFVLFRLEEDKIVVKTSGADVNFSILNIDKNLDEKVQILASIVKNVGEYSKNEYVIKDTPTGVKVL